MKIVIVGGVPDSLTLFRGPLIRRLVGLGHDVLALAGHEEARITSELRELGARFATYPLARRGTGPLADLATCRALQRIFRVEKPDIVFAYTAKPVVWGGIASRLARVPRFFAMVTGLGGQFGNSGRGGPLATVLSGLYRVALGRAQAVVFQNRDDRHLFVERGLVPEALTRRVDGSGVDLSAYTPRPLPDGPLVFLMVSRLLAAKGVREFAEAARTVGRERSGVRFVLAGATDEGSADSIPLAEVRRWEADDVLRYVGHVKGAREVLAACHVFVLPSYYGEGVPRTILEAMACGRPVLTTDNVGCRDAVEHDGNGLVVPPRDVAALADGMRWFLDHPERREPMATRGLEIARERYDVDKVNDALLGIMELDGRSADAHR